MKNRTTLHTLTLCALIACVPLAKAEASAEKPLTVSRAGLDLGAPEGARILMRCIEGAARRYCRSQSYGSYRATLACTRMVMSDTIRRLGEPEVTTFWASTTWAIGQKAA